MCERDLPGEKFGKNKWKKDGLQSRCKACDCEYKKKRYHENKEIYKERSKNRKREIREWFQEYKQSLSCNSCGDERWYILEFHHSDPDSKDGNVVDMAVNGYSKDRILEEIEKCEVLCANCHRELHYLERCGS